MKVLLDHGADVSFSIDVMLLLLCWQLIRYRKAPQHTTPPKIFVFAVLDDGIVSCGDLENTTVGGFSESSFSGDLTTNHNLDLFSLCNTTKLSMMTFHH